MKKDKILMILATITVVAIVACALTGGTTKFIGKVYVQSSSTAPTCTVATSDGDLCVASDLETNASADIGTTLNVGTTITAATSITSTSSQYVLVQENTGNTCTIGELKVDTSSTKELCYCAATNTFYCIDFTTTSGAAKD